jgi:DNA-directed RNA polymerase specialized sigma24 family protein
VNHAVHSTSCERIALVPETNIDFEYELCSGFAARHIRQKARELCRHFGDSVCDLEDLRQELTLLVWQSLDAFKPHQGCFNAFVKLIVFRDAIHLKRKLSIEKRQREQTCSLNAMIDSGDGHLKSHSHCVGEHELAARTGNTSRPSSVDVELAHDVDAALKMLDARLRYVAWRLMYESPAEVARHMRLSRTTIYNLILKIRKRFSAGDLGHNPRYAGLHFAPRSGSTPYRRPSHHTQSGERCGTSGRPSHAECARRR